MKYRGFTTDELCDSLFELEVNRLSPAEESDAGHAVAPLVQSAMRGSFDARMIRQPEVVVGSQHHNFFAFDGDQPALLAFERDFVLEGLGFFDFFQLVVEC